VVAGHLPEPITGAAAFTLGGAMYVAGGQTAPGRPGQATASPSAALTTSRAVLRYRPGHPAVLAGSLPVPVANAAAGVLGATAYLVGGDDGQRPVPTVTEFRLVNPAAPASAPWLGPPHGRGHLRPHSDPAALPGDVLIADHHNNRLLVIDPQGRIRWQFPKPGDLTRGQAFKVPDDAFFSPDGKDIVATEEDDAVISVINIATHRITYRYGTPGKPGPGANHVSNPDDAMLLPGGDMLSADIKNCRILLVRPPAHRPARIIGQTSSGCWHDPPRHFGSPNGAFPMTNGKYLITEINGDWANAVSLSGHVSWSANPPGVSYPSDTNEVYPGLYLTADYSSPGQVVEFTASGQLRWRFGGLDHPSLALPLPNGDILVNDDYHDRVIVIDPVSNRIVWQYGHTGVAGTRPGYLNDPDGVDMTPPGSLLITHAATMGRP
jgi:DNA-binding beta-propeller fold protein YncE